MDELLDVKKQELEKQNEEVIKARLGRELNEMTPLEEVRKLNKETRELVEQLRETEQRIQKTAANLILGGKSEAGSFKQPKLSAQEEARQKGSEFVNKWFSK